MLTSEQIKNHLKTWQKRWRKINNLKNLSVSLFNEKTYMITMDVEHYNSHVADHKGDAEYLNKTLLHYKEMEKIFRDSMASGKFAKDTSAALDTPDDDADNQEEEEEVTGHGVSDGPSTQAVTSSATRPSKRAKIAEIEEDGLIGAIKGAGKDLSEATKLIAKSDNDLPNNLFQTLNSIPGFNSTHISFYYAYLAANPTMGRAWYNLPYENKWHWISQFIAEKFPGM